MIASSHRSRHPATGWTGDVCGSGWVLVLPVTPEFTASFVAAAEAVFTSHARELPVQSTISIRQLRAALNGRVITPGDTGYDHARTVF